MHAALLQNLGKISAAPDNVRLKTWVDLIQHKARPARFGELEQRAVLQPQASPGREALYVQSTDGQILAHGPRSQRVPLKSEFLEFLLVLNENRAVGSDVLFVFMAVADKSVGGQLGLGPRCLGDPAVR